MKNILVAIVSKPDGNKNRSVEFFPMSVKSPLAKLIIFPGDAEATELYAKHSILRTISPARAFRSLRPKM